MKYRVVQDIDGIKWSGTCEYIKCEYCGLEYEKDERHLISLEYGKKKLETCWWSLAKWISENVPSKWIDSK